MPVQANADHNVPALPGRARYNVVSTQPVWVYHEMDAGAALAGEAPRTAATDEAATDPSSVKAGRARWTALTKGGLFTLLAHSKQPLVVEAIDNPNTATLSIVDSQGNALRSVPTAPFKLEAGACLKAVGGGNGGKVGFLVRVDTQKVW